MLVWEQRCQCFRLCDLHIISRNCQRLRGRLTEGIVVELLDNLIGKLNTKTKNKMGEETLIDFLKNKKTAKKGLCDKLSFDHKMPLIGLVIDLELSEDDVAIIESLLEGTSALDVEIVVLADTNLDSFSFPHVHHVPYSQQSREHLMKASDMMVALPHNDIDEWLLNGVVPITHLREGISNYDPNQEVGNSFVYGDVEDTDQWKIFAALVRALETYKFPYDWKSIVGTGLKSVQDR